MKKNDEIAAKLCRKVLRISKPFIKTENEKSRMYATLSVDDSHYDAYYEVDKKYEEFLTPELSDAFLVNVLLYAMEHNYDIECEGEISEKLCYQISNYLIPAISRNIPKYKLISIRAKLVNYNFESKAVATGFSCGVDSFYTVLKHLNNKDYRDYNLSHLCYFNAGASGDYGGEKSRELYLSRKAKFKAAAKKLNCDFVSVDTNINEYIMQMHQASHTFRTLAIPLAMQKLFNKYFFSSSYVFTNFRFAANDPGSYDLLNTKYFSTQNIEFILVGAENLRIEKVDFISNYDVTYSELNVCVAESKNSYFKEGYNCSHCPKCKKTMMDLYLLGKLDLYKDIFDTAYFYKNKFKMVVWALVFKNRIADMHEIIASLKTKKEITILHYISYLMVRTRNMFRKIFRK